MTSIEAKECIEELKQYNQNGELKTPVNNDVSMLWDGAFGMVIDLFEEIQQYRAIGTVEDIQPIFSLCEDLKDVIRQYEKIGTIEEFKALKEKNEPKKPLDGGEVLRELCPTCGRFISKMNSPCYCPCGQKIDWSE